MEKEKQRLRNEQMRSTECIPSKEEIREVLEKRHSKEIQDKIATASVAICGLGGLGSNIAIALARCGIGRLHLIDFDEVDLSNLNRQQYNIAHLGKPKPQALKEELLAINPYLKIETDYIKITEKNIEKLLQQEDYICEAFDVPEQKAMLTNYVLEHMPEKYLVGASGMAGYGNSNTIVTRNVLRHFYLCGDGVSKISDKMGLMAPRVMICAAHQANMVLELILSE